MSKIYMLLLHLHVHWEYVHSVQGNFGYHSDYVVKLGYLSNGSDWLQVGQTGFDFLEAVEVFKLSPCRGWFWDISSLLSSSTRSYFAASKVVVCLCLVSRLRIC
jgi:hypothetical protein